MIFRDGQWQKLTSSEHLRFVNDFKFELHPQYLAVLLCVLIVLGLGHLYLNDDLSDEMVLDVLRDSYDSWHNCIVFQMAEKRHNAAAIWESIGNISHKCEERTRMGELRIRSYENRDETKYHILPLNPSDKSIIVTLGIGMDVDAERKLKKQIHRETHFYGADPVMENRKVFEPIGTFLPFAVSGKSEISKASVLSNGTYKDQDVLHVDFAYLLSEMIDNPSRIYDNIWIDAEWGEYSMFPEFYKDGKLDRNGIHICQFNLEVHSADDNQKQLFTDFIDRVLNDRRYIFLKLSTVAGHWRMYFINFSDLECGKKYLVEA